ncbi:MAG: hypothetical protein NVSMB55_10680 [Mycobacteriales bacterium]
MRTRAARTATLAGPNRLAIGAATAGLVLLASLGVSLLVVTGTSVVAPPLVPSPPLPTAAPLAQAPGVVVLPQVPGGSPSSVSPSTGSRGHRTSPTVASPVGISPVRRTDSTLLALFTPAPLRSVVVGQPVRPTLADAAPAPAGGQAPSALTRDQVQAQRRAARDGGDIAALLGVLGGYDSSQAGPVGAAPSAALLRSTGIPVAVPGTNEAGPAALTIGEAASDKGGRAHAHHRRRHANQRADQPGKRPGNRPGNRPGTRPGKQRADAPVEADQHGKAGHRAAAQQWANGQQRGHGQQLGDRRQREEHAKHVKHQQDGGDS